MRIAKATKKEVKKFNVKEWHEVDIEHYGKRVEWKMKDFIYKATEGGEIVGTISGQHESGVIYINGLIIAQKRRGLGIGKKLVEQAERFGKKMGAHKVHLLTGKDWKATKFYEALDYVKIADLPKHHFKIDFAIYEKFI